MYDLQQLIRAEEDERQHQLAYKMEDVEYYGEPVGFSNPVKADFKFSKNREGLSMCLLMTVTYHIRCARCLRDTAKKISIDRRYHLMPENSAAEVEEEENDILWYRDHRLDLVELIREEIFLHLPLKAVCQPDCGGICHQCGQERGTEGSLCQCKEQPENEPDSRLIKLKDWYQRE